MSSTIAITLMCFLAQIDTISAAVPPISEPSPLTRQEVANAFIPDCVAAYQEQCDLYANDHSMASPGYYVDTYNGNSIRVPATTVREENDMLHGCGRPFTVEALCTSLAGLACNQPDYNSNTCNPCGWQLVPFRNTPLTTWECAIAAPTVKLPPVQNNPIAIDF